MPAYSKEREAEFISRIRPILTKEPTASVRTVQRILKRSKNAPLKLDKDYVWKLMKKVQKERTSRLNHRTVSVVLARFEDEIEEIKQKCWEIISDPLASDSEKLSAMRELRLASDNFIQRVVNSGLMERKPDALRQENTPGMKLAETLKNANPEQRLKFVELVGAITSAKLP
jgi:hypothetical protein